MSEPNTGKKAATPMTRGDPSAELRAKIWERENAASIAERRAWIETEGTPLADVQVLQYL